MRQTTAQAGFEKLRFGIPRHAPPLTPMSENARMGHKQNHGLEDAVGCWDKSAGVAFFLLSIPCLSLWLGCLETQTQDSKFWIPDLMNFFGHHSIVKEIFMEEMLGWTPSQSTCSRTLFFSLVCCQCVGVWSDQDLCE